jgi:hypothetical protein
MISDGSSLHNGIGANVYMVPNLHRIVIEVPAVCFVWRSKISKLLEYLFGLENNMECHLMTQPSSTRQYLPNEMTTA